MKSLYTVQKLLFLSGIYFCSLALAQNSTAPAKNLPKKTLAETLGLPKAPVVGQTSRVTREGDSQDPLAPSNLKNDNPALQPSSGTIVVHDKPMELSKKDHHDDCDDHKSCGGSCSLKGHHSSKARGLYASIFYTHSRWSDFTSALDDGSIGFELGAVREIFPNFEGGLGFGWFSGVPDTASGDNQFYAFYFGARSTWEILDTTFTPTAGLDINFGTYKIWAVSAESASDITYSKLSAGTLFGLTPHVGLRFKASEHSSVDLNIGYVGYADAPQWRLGGWSTGLTFSFLR